MTISDTTDAYMTPDAFDTLNQLWWKKDVPLSWEGEHLSFAVAQELFSSHTVDAGSLLLLRTLDPAAMPNRGTCVDFGCGYGILGLAFKAVRHGWDVTLIDRDALAVEFSAWNADRLGLDVTCRGALGIDSLDAPVDLLLWNVPGKAGPGVLEHLTNQAFDRLAPNGMLAMVVVHPLAKGLEEVALGRSDVEIRHESAGKAHTVFHMKRRANAEPSLEGDAFGSGFFDREPVDVDTGLIQYRFTPVVGLPMYDGPDIATVLLTDEIEGVGREHVNEALCLFPGQGHVPLYIRDRWPDTPLTLVDRDALAIAATSRAVGGSVHSTFISLPGAGDDNRYDLMTAMIPDQMRPPVMQHMLDEAVRKAAPGGQIAFGGGSTEVSRLIALARKHPELKQRGRDKKKGFSAAIFERTA